MGPDERALYADLQSVEFLIGVSKGQWGLAALPNSNVGLPWPHSLVWIAATPRACAPDRFFFRLDCLGYPTVPPTGTVWDLVANEQLSAAGRPKGTGQVEMMFRTDWEGGRAFYHPYDRVAAQSHPDWPGKYPHLLWNPSTHTIVLLLSELYALLHSPNYRGIGQSPAS
jgi:hypothetical protein